MVSVILRADLDCRELWSQTCWRLQLWSWLWPGGGRSDLGASWQRCLGLSWGRHGLKGVHALVPGALQRATMAAERATMAAVGLGSRLQSARLQDPGQVHMGGVTKAEVKQDRNVVGMS